MDQIPQRLHKQGIPTENYIFGSIIQSKRRCLTTRIYPQFWRNVEKWKRTETYACARLRIKAERRSHLYWRSSASVRRTIKVTCIRYERTLVILQCLRPQQYSVGRVVWYVSATLPCILSVDHKIRRINMYDWGGGWPSSFIFSALAFLSFSQTRETRKQ